MASGTLLVQVKSNMDPWVFGSSESVRWIIEHPLPIFLCVALKKDARVLVYQTVPRFAAWIAPKQPEVLVLVPGTESNAQTVGWNEGSEFLLRAPILNFTISELLEDGAREHLAQVLRFWIDYDVENLHRIRAGIHHLRVPYAYSTNNTEITGLSEYGFQQESMPLAEDRLAELLSHVTTHHYDKGDLVAATITQWRFGSFVPQVTQGRSIPTINFCTAR
jgi:hypothetical protein